MLMSMKWVLEGRTAFQIVLKKSPRTSSSQLLKILHWDTTLPIIHNNSICTRLQQFANGGNPWLSKSSEKSLCFFLIVVDAIESLSSPMNSMASDRELTIKCGWKIERVRCKNVVSYRRLLLLMRDLELQPITLCADAWRVCPSCHRLIAIIKENYYTYDM